LYEFVLKMEIHLEKQILKIVMFTGKYILLFRFENYIKNLIIKVLLKKTKKGKNNKYVVKKLEKKTFIFPLK